MKIAIISDIHENYHNLTVFFHEIEKHKIGKILCLGDLINNGIAKLLAASPIPIFTIWGNNDGGQAAIMRTSLGEGSNLEIGLDTFDIIEIEGKKFFLTHYPMLAKPMAKSGDFDAVFYGHDHISNIDKIGDCLILNPGEISAHKTSKATFAIYDIETQQAEIINLDGVITTKTELSDNYRDKSGLVFGKTKSHKY